MGIVLMFIDVCMYMNISKNIVLLATAMTLSGLSTQAQKYVEQQNQTIWSALSSSNTSDEPKNSNNIRQITIAQAEENMHIDSIINRYNRDIVAKRYNHYQEIVKQYEWNTVDKKNKEEIDKIYQNIYTDGQEYMDIYRYERVIDSKTLQVQIAELCQKEEKIYKTAIKHMKKNSK